jgi:sarcosine oxidase
VGERRGAVVIGLGLTGSTAALWLARAGVDVLALDQFEPGHVRASSHGHSRVVRRSHPNTRHVQLAAEAFEVWRQLESMGDTELLTTVGGIDLFPPDSSLDPDAVSSALWSAGAAFDWLDGNEVRTRWPVFVSGSLVGSDVRGVHCADTAIVPPGRTLHLVQHLAVRDGAELRPHTPVRAIRPADHGVDVVVDGDEDVEIIEADRVVIAAGAWSDRLLAPLGVPLGVVARREQHCWLPHHRLRELTIGSVPAWTWHGQRVVHGLPVYGVTDAVKCWERDGAIVADPDGRSHVPDAESESRIRAFHDQLLGPGATTPRTTTWLSVESGDGDLVCGALAADPRVVVGLPPRDGVMFAPWIGRELAALASGASPRPIVAPYAPDRATLRGVVSG